MKRSKKAIEIEGLIKKHQDLYYNGRAEITDDEFDSLWDSLKLIEPDNPLFKSVGKDSSDGFRKAKHIIPMGSQEKASSVPAFLEWKKKQKKDEFIVQYKLDGASLELQYKDGSLIRCVTRGDGKFGDDITENAIKMDGVLKKLVGDASHFSGAVRGEVLMPKKTFSARYKDKANCRNAANGIMKRKDGKGCEDLVVVCYDVGVEESLFQKDGLLFSMEENSKKSAPYKDEIEKIEWLKKAGFHTVQTQIFKSAQDVIEYREKISKMRDSLDYDIDGLVVKNIEIDLEDLKRVRPEKQIAFKFETEKAVSIIRDVEWSESGATYTPIAIIDAVHLAGTTVKRASLANPNVIKNLDLKIGSRILVSKRGEIIPKIEALIENPATSFDIKTPENCSSCGTILKNEGTRLYCPNINCKKVREHRVEKWVKVLDMKEVGDTLLKRLFLAGSVKKIKDLYELKEADIANIERMGELSSKKVYLSIRAKKEISLSEFIAGFDLEDIGITMAEKIVEAGYTSLEKLKSASAEDIEKIDGFAEKMASSFIKNFRDVKDEMQELLDSGYISIKKEEEKSKSLSGLSFCFTGEMESMSRKEAESLCKSLGATVKNSVTKGLNFLVTNTPESGSNKNEKAKALNIKIISEAEWKRLIST